MSADISERKLNNQNKSFRARHEETNPCFKENNLSLKCLDDNFHDHSKCRNFFENYKKCKAFWNFVQQERKIKGIWPHLPIPEERASAKEQYLPHFKG